MFYEMDKECFRANYISLAERKKQMRNTTKVYVNNAERKALVTTLGLPSLVLMQYYYECSGRSNKEITDKRASYATGMTIRQVSDARRKLIKHQWFKISMEGTRTIYCIGRQAVKDDWDQVLYDLPKEELITLFHICYKYSDAYKENRLINRGDLVKWIEEII